MDRMLCVRSRSASKHFYSSPTESKLDKLQLAFALTILLVATSFVIVGGQRVIGDFNTVLDPSSAQPCHSRDPLMDPTYEIRYGQDVIWQIPARPKAVLFLAHGANKDALGFFDPAPKCKPCYGLPGDRTVVLDALRRGYAVIAVKSIGTSYRSWPEDSPDLVSASNIIKEWTTEHSLESLPLSAWGQSSGGFFVTALSRKVNITSLVVMCSEGQAEVIQSATSTNFPSTLFAYMPRDLETIGVTTRVNEAMALLKERGVCVAEYRFWPKPVSHLLFTERILCVTSNISEKIYAAFKAEKWLDGNDYLIKSPRTDDWELVLTKSNALPYCTELKSICLAPHVEEELEMAYAEHTISSYGDDKIYSWLDFSLSPSYRIDCSDVQSTLGGSRGFYR